MHIILYIYIDIYRERIATQRRAYIYEQDILAVIKYYYYFPAVYKYSNQIIVHHFHMSLGCSYPVKDTPLAKDVLDPASIKEGHPEIFSTILSESDDGKIIRGIVTY